MISLTVWKFDDPLEAERVVPRLRGSAVNGRIRVEDAAVVSWPAGHRKPTAQTLGSLTGPGTLWGGVWGLLLGLIFLTPIAGPTFGAGAGALGGALSDFGVDDEFVTDVRGMLTDGTSGLFLLTSTEVAEDLGEILNDLRPDLVRCDVPLQNERWLREALGEESLPPGG